MAATIHNPHDFDIYCPALGEIVRAGETVDAADEQASEVPSTGTFVVEGLPEPKPAAPAAPAAPEENA